MLEPDSRQEEAVLGSRSGVGAKEQEKLPVEHERHRRPRHSHYPHKEPKKASNDSVSRARSKSFDYPAIASLNKKGDSTKYDSREKNLLEAQGGVTTPHGSSTSSRSQKPHHHSHHPHRHTKQAYNGSVSRPRSKSVDHPTDISVPKNGDVREFDPREKTSRTVRSDPHEHHQHQRKSQAHQHHKDHSPSRNSHQRNDTKQPGSGSHAPAEDMSAITGTTNDLHEDRHSHKKHVHHHHNKDDHPRHLIAMEDLIGVAMDLGLSREEVSTMASSQKASHGTHHRHGQHHDGQHSSLASVTNRSISRSEIDASTTKSMRKNHHHALHDHGRHGGSQPSTTADRTVSSLGHTNGGRALEVPSGAPVQPQEQQPKPSDKSWFRQYWVLIAVVLAIIVAVAVTVPLLVTSSSDDKSSWAQVGQDIEAERTGDRAGWSVSMSADGTAVAIGSPWNDGMGSMSGHVRVFRYTEGQWKRIGNDIDGEAKGDEAGFSVALSADGTTVAVGSPLHFYQRGRVRVYRLQGSSWTQVGSALNGINTEDGIVEGDRLGWSISLSADGSMIAVGAPGTWGSQGRSSGRVRVYKEQGGTWSKVGNDLDGEASSDKFGTSVSLSADGMTVAAGAPNNNDSWGLAGHVRVYHIAGDGWHQVGNDIGGEYYDDKSGTSVSLSADGMTVAIGAPNNDGNGGDAGHVRVYQLVGGEWSRAGSDIDGEVMADRSGTSVSLSADGKKVAVGAPNNDGNGGNAGHVRVYQFVGSNWSRLGNDIDGEAAGDLSGTSVSLSADGKMVAIGAIDNEGNGGRSGHVRVYQLPQ